MSAASRIMHPSRGDPRGLPRFETKILINFEANMNTPSSSTRVLARRLLVASKTASNPHVPEAVLVIEKLRTSLTKFAGFEGFASLLRRALLLASADVPSLKSVKVASDGRLEGYEQLVADKGTGAAGDGAAVAITAHLLWLLVTFIGEPLTLTLVREAWSDNSLDECNSTRETD
jgi:hypothetical protein